MQSDGYKSTYKNARDCMMRSNWHSPNYFQSVRISAIALIKMVERICMI